MPKRYGYSTNYTKRRKKHIVDRKNIEQGLLPDMRPHHSTIVERVKEHERHLILTWTILAYVCFGILFIGIAFIAITGSGVDSYSIPSPTPQAIPLHP